MHLTITKRISDEMALLNFHITGKDAEISSFLLKPYYSDKFSSWIALTWL